LQLGTPARENFSYHRSLQRRGGQAMDTTFFILSKLAGLGLQVETWVAIGLSLSGLGGL
jgi:hypothetical protein